MDIKRLTSALIGFPLVVIILVFGNKYIVDVTFAIVAIISLHEYFNAFKEKEVHPVIWIGYLVSVLIAGIHLVPTEYICLIIGFLLPTSIAILFLQVILSNMKTTINDIAVTFFGICYISVFLMFVPLLNGLENGKLLIWYIFTTAWGTDIFAYLIGKTIGKHKFSKISPNKSIEGCIGGVIGSVVLSILCTVIFNNFFGMNFSYVYIILISVVLSIIGQIGDFAASSIKRYVGIKDFGNLIPGHGGMLDRIDSVIFIAPFAFMLLGLL